MSAWISAAITTPPLVDGESEFVLVATRWTPHPLVAKHRFIKDLGAGRDDPPGWSDWVLFGRDGYLVEGVTHWMNLPEMPR